MTLQLCSGIFCRQAGFFAALGFWNHLGLYQKLLEMGDFHQSVVWFFLKCLSLEIALALDFP